MIKTPENNIKANEIRIIYEKYSKLLQKFNLSIKEIYFVGSRVNSRAKKTSDLDIVIIPKVKTWNSAQEYTNIMRGILSYSDKIKFRGNDIDFQLENTFYPGSSFGECYIKLKNNVINKTCPKGEGHHK
jgi:predicted nucleotidyltransferase